MEPVNEEPAPPADDQYAGPHSGEVSRYEKPVIRRYDQMDQLRPYGPSEV